MFKLVNGFPCSSGCDVALAKKGVDPRNPHQDPLKQEQLDARDPAKANALRARDDASVTFGGRLAGWSVASEANFATASTPGRLLDLTV